MRFQLLDAAHRTAGRLRDALADPARRERNVLAALALYAALWTLYGTIAKSSQGLHPDMTELIAWSRDLAFGYAKHPPLAAWLVALWFSAQPVAEWSYYLLAMLMPTLTLWIIWRGSADYLDVEKRLVGLALLTFVPFFNFQALKFNVNTLLMPLWAATTFAFLRSYTQRSARYALLAGIAAAACMLTKYWSVFLIGGLIIAALSDKRHADYFRSVAPWLTVAAGALVLAPHIVWLVQNDFAPFGYAMTVHGEKSFAAAALGALGYLAGALGYVAVPLLVVMAAARPSRKTLADLIWPADRNRRLAATAFWAPLLLPVIAALASGTVMNSLWSMSAWSLLPVVLLSPPDVKLSPIHTRRVIVGALALPLAALIASPLVALAVHGQGPRPASAQARLLADEVERAWHAITPQPLRFVGGDTDIAYGVIAYARDRPRALPGLPRPSALELSQSGEVLVCFAEDADCWHAAARSAAKVGPSRTLDVEVARAFLGMPGREQRYAITLVPPL